RILGALDNSSQSGLSFFGPFAFDELAQLPAQRPEQLKKILVRFTQLTAETFNHPDHLLPQLQRKTKRAMKSLLGRHGRAREVRVFGDLLDPGGFAAA